MKQNKTKFLQPSLTRGAALLLAALVAGCQSAPSRWDGSVKNEINASLKEAKQTSMNLPPEVNQALLPPMTLNVPAAADAPLEPRFDLSASNTPARQVFMSLVEDTPYSMVVHPEVSGTISLHLKNVTVPEAVDALRQVYGYDFRRDDHRFYILGQGLQTRLFPVNYLALNRKGRSETRVSSGELTQGNSNGNGENGNSNGDSGGDGGSRRANSIQVETLSDSHFWQELRGALEAIIGTEEGRRVVVQPQAGLVIVRAMPDELAMVEHYLGITQSTVNRQVVLEAKVVEVELNDGFQAGINWAALGGVGDVDYLLGQTGGGTLLNSGVSDLASKSGNLQPDANFAPVKSGLTSAFGGMFSLALKTPDFAAFVELLQTQGNVHVLSSPRVSTVNNQKAVIKVGGDEFFVTGVSNSASTTGSTTTQTPSVELTPFFSGIALDVTPQIDSNSNITLHIHPTVSNVQQKDKSFVISGESFSLPLAFSTIQESDNVVRAHTGQVIVIGGLMKEAVTTQNASVPLLGDLPVIGNLFKHQKITRIKKELVILLKPTVVDGNQVWTDSIQSSQRRAADLLDTRKP